MTATRPPGPPHASAGTSPTGGFAVTAQVMLARLWAATVASRMTVFLVLVVLSAAWLWQPLSTVIAISLRYGLYEHYSHIVLIPVVSAALIYLHRRAIFRRVASAPALGGALIVAGGMLALIAQTGPVTDPERPWVSLALLALVALVVGAFALCFGTDALRSAAFPMGFLLFMVPFPPSLLHSTIVFLQRGSAEMTYVLFNLIGVPVYREGFYFALPGLAIEVAEECSGIRSFLSLLVTSVLAGHLMLRTARTRIALAVAILPIAIVKNAVRIVVLSLLAIHVDPGFITGGALHRLGGIPLFVVTLLVIGGLIWLLQRLEARLAGTPAGA
jgi:exosortase